MSMASQSVSALLLVLAMSSCAGEAPAQQPSPEQPGSSGNVLSGSVSNEVFAPLTAYAKSDASGRLFLIFPEYAASCDTDAPPATSANQLEKLVVQLASDAQMVGTHNLSYPALEPALASVAVYSYETEPMEATTVIIRSGHIKLDALDSVSIRGSIVLSEPVVDLAISGAFEARACP